MRYKISMPRGFGVVEAIIVVAALVIVAVILFPVLTPSNQKNTTALHCTNNQRQIALAWSEYVQRHDETFPDASIAWTLFKKENAPVYRCPDHSAAVNGYVFNARLS